MCNFVSTLETLGLYQTKTIVILVISVRAKRIPISNKYSLNLFNFYGFVDFLKLCNHYLEVCSYFSDTLMTIPVSYTHLDVYKRQSIQRWYRGFNVFYI